MENTHCLPTLERETRLWAAGYRAIAGLDEAGRGAWAGPVVAGAVILPPDPSLASHLAGVRDSKQLTSARREQLLPRIQECALAWGVGIVAPEVIDTAGIGQASRQAMMQALQALGCRPDYLLIDYFRLPGIALPQFGLPKGDALVLSIAAASIVAKVSRDRLMIELDGQVPGYGWAQNKGYGTPAHQAALAALGPSRLHRRSFAPIAALNQPKVPRDE
jgi:ribonuclease HII